MNTKEIILLDKKFSAEELCGLEQELYESISQDYNPTNIPLDENNLARGTFHVTIKWVADE